MKMCTPSEIEFTSYCLIVHELISIEIYWLLQKRNKRKNMRKNGNNLLFFRQLKMEPFSRPSILNFYDYFLGLTITCSDQLKQTTLRTLTLTAQ